jgi:hypothetical protein
MINAPLESCLYRVPSNHHVEEIMVRRIVITLILLSAATYMFAGITGSDPRSPKSSVTGPGGGLPSPIGQE